jgi:putative DNA primase/helicase
MWRDRILGISQNVTVPTCTTWFASGNNISVAGDLTSRVLLCRIDPKCERPDEREFEIDDLRSYVRLARGELVRAALTVLRAYVVAGLPAQDAKPFGRFEEWSAIVRKALLWLDVDDPCMTQEIIRRDDPVRAGLAQVLAAWEAAIGFVPVTTAEVIRQATDSATFTQATASAHAALKDALEAVLYKGEIKPRQLGIWIAQNVDRVINGLSLRRLKPHLGSVVWKLEKSAE